MSVTVDLEGYDFLDFGASSGGCIDFARAKLGGRNGLGIDRDPLKVAQMRAKGCCACGGRRHGY